MLLTGMKIAVSPLPRCVLSNPRYLHLSSSTSFIKVPAILRRGNKQPSSKEEEQRSVTREYYVPRRFIPMTRRALVRRILEEEQLINPRDRNRLQEFSDVLDKAIAGTLHGVLGELKVGRHNVKLDSLSVPQCVT